MSNGIVLLTKDETEQIVVKIREVMNPKLFPCGLAKYSSIECLV
jgi:hypothetical protein